MMFLPIKWMSTVAGCMLNEREMKYRIACCHDQGVPITNYGLLIAQVTGILKRSLGPFPEMQKLV